MVVDMLGDANTWEWGGQESPFPPSGDAGKELYVR